MEITVVEGDITQQQVDAVVNAANNGMRGRRRGRGDPSCRWPGDPGRLHRALSGRVGHRRRRLDRGRRPGCAVGDPRRRPRPNAGETDRSLLTSCYARAIEVAEELGARTVAFPLVSAGVYGWPKDDAIAAAIETLRNAHARGTSVTEARLVAFDHSTYTQIAAALAG